MDSVSSSGRTPDCGRCGVRMDRAGRRAFGDDVVREAYQCPECGTIVVSDVRR